MTSLFPSIVPFKIDIKLANKLNDIVIKKGYKTVTRASVYNINDETEVINDDTRYNSWKNEFDDEQIRNILDVDILPIIKRLLENKYNDRMFYLSIGNQKLDYILYTKYGHFKVHHDFVAIHSQNMCQYTCLIGLTKDKTKNNHGGQTTIYTPIKNDKDFEKIKQSDFQHLQLFHKSGEPIGIPHQYDAYKMGNCLMFKSELFHAGEQFYGKKKELLMFTINMIGIAVNKNQTCDNLIINTSDNLIINTSDNEKYSVPRSFLSNTIFSNMNNFYGSNNLNTEMNSSQFKLLLNFIATGNYSLDDNTNLLIQSYVCLDCRFYDCEIPNIYHKKINEWQNSSCPYIKFDKFEPFMINFAKEYNLIPFQVILCQSSMNNENEYHKFVKYFNFDDDIETKSTTNLLHRLDLTLKTIYDNIKNKNNDYIQLQNPVNITHSMYFNNNAFEKDLLFSYFKVDNFHHLLKLIHNITENIDFEDNFIFKKHDNINGNIEISEWCNDGTYHYYENTTIYFSCKMDIKFYFVDQNKI